VGPKHLRRAVAGAAAAVLLRPDLARLDRRWPTVDIAPFRPHTTVALGVLAAALAAPRRSRPHAAGIGFAALAAAPAWVGRLRRRALDPGPADLTVLAANVLVGRADTGALATLLERERPDLVSLPEAGPDFRDKLQPLIADLGYRSWASTARGTSDGEGVVLLASARAGDVAVTTGPRMRHRYLRATGGILGERSFYAVHPEAPMTPGRTDWWRRDLGDIGEWCREPLAPIVAGDFNATLDHAAMRDALGGCRSAAEGTGRGLTATFPASLPRALGLQIDHVLVPLAATVTRFDVLDVEGSDHRAVLAGIRLP
jgi:endonuclease/exonuclease/phosphatase (EEP) superfamily protein YafD